MRSRTGWLRAGIMAALVAFGCTTGDDLATDPGEDGIPELTLEVLGQHQIRLQWAPAPTLALHLERRVNLQGEFAAVGGDLPRGQTSLIDEDLQADTYYGYRLVASDAFGSRVGTSPVAGGRTAPPPGINLSVITSPTDPPSVDPDGYQLTIEGPTDTIRTPIDVITRRLFSPLAAGAYRVAVDGLAAQCSSTDSLSRTVTVTQDGMETVQSVAIAIQCRNPNRGQVTAVLTATGELPDPDGFQVTLDGLADDASLPGDERAFHQAKPVGPAGGSVSFEDVRPGSYQFTIDGLALNCTLTGPQDQFPVAALEQVEQRFAIDCPDPGAASRPFALRPTWVPAQAPAGTAVALELPLDLTARPGQDLAAFETEIDVDQAVLRYDSTAALDIPTVVSNQALPGVILVSGFATGTGPTGVIKLARVWFTVVGADGRTARTNTKHTNTVGSDGTGLDGDIRVIESSFTVGTGGGGGGGGGGGNQAPQANANGPYAGTAGQAVSLSAAGSSDPDGTIATYAWTFGDGASGTGASTTHTYASAGSYTATLTVTDNGGLTASATAPVTISSGGGGGGGGGSNECGSGTAEKPFVLCSVWSPATAAAADKVVLTQTIDLSSDGAQDLVAFESTVVTDPTLVRYDSAKAGAITNLVVNGNTPGTVRLGGFLTGNSGPKGVVTTAKAYYTVLAASGTVAPDITFSNFVGTSGTILDGKITADAGTLTIGAGGSGTGGATGGDTGGSGGGTGGTGTGGDGGGSSGGGGGTSALDWQSSFGPVDGVTRMVPLNLTLDLRSDPAVTLAGWQVTDLQWDPAVLSYASTELNGTGTVDPTDALSGHLRLSGIPAAGANGGLVTVAVVHFVAFAAPGASSATHMTLGPVTGRSGAGTVDLLPRVVVHEGSFVTP